MNDKITAYFKNGILYKIRPFTFKKLYDDRERAYEARYIVSNGVKYDLMDLDSIHSIEMPVYEQDAAIGVTGSLEHVLNKHLPTGDDKIDLQILRVYTMLLKHSYWVYGDKDWYRLPKKLYELGDFEKGDSLLEQIEQYRPKISNTPLKRKNLREFVEDNRKVFNGDLIEIQASYTRCELCARYAGRIYSVNGEDKRFPKCPEWIIQKGGICDNGCGSAIFPFFYSDVSTIMVYREKYGSVDMVNVDPVVHSNRPFTDNRNDAEIERYNKLQMQREEEALKSKYYMLNYRNFCYGRINDPQNTPKSFSAYMRKLKKEGRHY